LKFFLQYPCESREELFDRDEELKLGIKCVKNNVWIAILGLRMSGKTSLAKVIANELKREGYTPIYVNLIGVRGIRDSAERIFSSIPQGLLEKLEGLKGFLEALGLRFGFEVKFKLSISASKILERLFLELSRKRKLIVILDEVQEIRGGINRFLALLYRLRTSTRNLVFIFTGSAIGLMKTLLNPTPRSPLYGRTPIKIELKPWDIETAHAYLESGLSKCGINYTARELNEVISTLGTLTGWLSFYGLRRCMGLSHERSLEEAKVEAIKIALNEIHNILRNREEWAKRVLRMMCYGARWSELLNETGASKEALRTYLKTLKNLYLITMDDHVYRIVDPIYRLAILKHL